MAEEFPYKPRSRKQEMMLDSKADFTIIGGAAGSSKSFTQILHPLSFIHDPNYNGIFFRRTTVQVNGQG